jgi:UDP:flavonoid glycosyltransferase YjiC (YdhE family)
VGEAVTLAHVARPLVLAEALDPARYEVHFACADHSRSWLAGVPHIRHWPLQSLSPDRFMAALAAGRPLYDESTLESYVEEDFRLLREIRPDLVVGDFRLSLSVSAPLAGVPFANLTNAHWSPYATVQRYPFQEHPLGKVIGIRLAEQLFHVVWPWIFRLHASSLNRVRRRHGFEPFADLRHAYTWGDYTFYADLPELVPTVGLPPTHRYLGPILWSPAVPMPPWWESIPTDRPLIYVTLGSSGQVRVLPAVISALAELPVNAMVATAGRVPAADLPPNVFSADYLPGLVAAARSALVVCNGGSATVYQALSQGKPLLGIVSNMDQHLTMGAVCDSRAGIVLRAERARRPEIAVALSTLLEARTFADAAKRVAGWCSEIKAPDRFAAEVAAICKSA